MSEKLNEYRDYYVQEQDTAVKQSAFKEGFNMALDLNLTDQFLDWAFSEEGQKYAEQLEEQTKDEYEKLSEVEGIKKFFKDTYDHWINKVFKPEYK